MKKLFGNNILTNCSYCEYGIKQENGNLCTLNRKIIDGNCKKFVYNPIKRVPIPQAKLQNFTKEDFSI